MSAAAIERLVSTMPEGQRRMLRTDLAALLAQTPTLRPAREAYVNNDGSAADVVALNGTVPMRFHGCVYNIPVSIYLPPRYPGVAPTVFVRPASNMVVKPGHAVVDRSGECARLPYLLRWAYPASSLAGLAAALSDAFGHDPPLYSVSSAEQRDMMLSGLGNREGSSARRPPMQAYSHPPQRPPSPSHFAPPPPPPQYPQITVDPAAERKKRALDGLRKRVAERLTSLGADIDVLLSRQAELEARGRELASFAEAAPEAIGRYDAYIAAAKRHAEETDRAVEAAREAPTPVDDLVLPIDPVSAQLLQAIADDAALEDTMYTLSRSITSDNAAEVLKMVRTLAREQFLARATAKKIFAVCAPPPVPASAAAAVSALPPPAYMAPPSAYPR